MTVRQAREHIEAQSKAKIAYRRVRYDDIATLELQFHIDLAKEHGLTDHAKESKVWSLAYEYGHSTGFHDMAMYYEDLADLVK
jgi:hypothetical protein